MVSERVASADAPGTLRFCDTDAENGNVGDERGVQSMGKGKRQEEVALA